MPKNTLLIIGSGIKFMSHLTVEAKSCIEKSDKVLYLVNEPVMEEWIQMTNKNAESLQQYYYQSPLRNDNYLSIAEYIVDSLKVIRNLCVVTYGHPTVFVQPLLHAAEIALVEGHEVTILPGISTEDCLFADLKIDPGSCGCQSFEATDFLLYRREYDASAHLVIWQPFVIGVLGVPINHHPEQGLELLKEYLSEKYSLDHEIVIYEAAQYPSFKPRIECVSLKNLPLAEISRLTTLYIKPNQIKKPNQYMLRKLECVVKNAGYLVESNSNASSHKR